MRNLELILDMNSLSYNPGNKNFYGNVCLNLNRIYYPDKDWNDYILRLLLTWAYNILNQDMGTLYFFDGPYEIEFKKNENILHLFIESLGTYNCEVQYFLQIIRENLIQICNMEKYSKVLDKKKVMSCVKAIDNGIMRISE